MQTKKQKTEQIVLLTVCLIILTWVIMFKANLCIGDLYFGFKSFNIIPHLNFKGDEGFLLECILNAIVFVPFGYSVVLLSGRHNHLFFVLVSFGLSVFYEGLQYVLAFGSTDITDVIFNGIGGYIGCVICSVLIKKDKEKFLNILNKILICVGIPLAIYCIVSTAIVFDLYILVK